MLDFASQGHRASRVTLDFNVADDLSVKFPVCYPGERKYVPFGQDLCLFLAFMLSGTLCLALHMLGLSLSTHSYYPSSWELGLVFLSLIITEAAPLLLIHVSWVPNPFHDLRGRTHKKKEQPSHTVCLLHSRPISNIRWMRLYWK